MNSEVSYDLPIEIENGLDLRELLTTGSFLHLNENMWNDQMEHMEPKNNENTITFGYIGEPVTSIQQFQKQLTNVDNNNLVKKKILVEGGGLPLDKKFTVSLAYSGFWENSNEPFDFAKISKPLVINLNDNGLLPGLQMAIESMLVGEMSVFLLSYKVMYGKLGIPPRIKPKSDCIFYIKLIKSIITPNKGNQIDFAEPNMFARVRREVQLIYSSGIILFKINNYKAAIREFNKAINMIHKCRLADQDEEIKQEILLKKLYLNLAVCHNKLKQPLKACTACNELNRLNGLWDNEKALFQNAKALRMIGDFDKAEKKLKAAMELSSNDSIIAELNLVYKLKESCNKKKIMSNRSLHNTNNNLVSDHFKSDVDNLIKNFKENLNLCKFTLPGDLNTAEKEYFKESCIKENLYFTEYNKNYLLEKDEENLPIESRADIFQ